MSALDQALRQIPFGYEANRVRSERAARPELAAVGRRADRVRERERKKALASSAPWSSGGARPTRLPIELVINAGYPRRPPKAGARARRPT